MTVESDLYTLLKGLVGDRVYPDVAPLSTPRPYITYQQIGGQVLSYVGPEVPSEKNGSFQINVWADSRLAAAALALQVEAAFIGATVFVASPESAPIAQHEPDLNLYGTIQDFSIWSNR